MWAVRPPDFDGAFIFIFEAWKHHFPATSNIYTYDRQVAAASRTDFLLLSKACHSKTALPSDIIKALSYSVVLSLGCSSAHTLCTRTASRTSTCYDMAAFDSTQHMHHTLRQRAIAVIDKLRESYFMRLIELSGIYVLRVHHSRAEVHHIVTVG